MQHMNKSVLSPPAPGHAMHVFCLCAQWCRTCDGYRTVFEETVSALRDAGVEGMWVDVEDQADALGAVDVENFPTLLIARGDAVLFFGPVTPHASTLARLLELGSIGYVKGITAALEEIESRNPMYAPFCAELNALVERFRLPEYTNRLKEWIYEDVDHV